MAKPFHKTELHKVKMKKNFAVLEIIVTFIAIFWAITMIKISGG